MALAPINHSAVLRTQLKAAAACVTLVVCLLGPLAAALVLLWQLCAQCLIGAALAAEACFLCYYFLVLVREFNHVPEQHAPAGYEPQQVVQLFLAHMGRVEDIRAYISAWFLDCPFESIREDNVKELCAYALWYKTLDQMKEEGLMPQLDDLLHKLQALHNVSLPPGYNPDLRFMSHLWDEVPHIYRPLVFYLVMEFLEVLCWGMLTINGFRRQKIQGCVYYTKGLPQEQQAAAVAALGSNAAAQQQGQLDTAEQQQQQGKGTLKQQRQQQRPSRQLPGLRPDSPRGPDSLDNSQPDGAAAAAAAAAEDVSSIPLVLLHGVGAGLLPYLGVIFLLASTGRPMILPVWKHVSMRLTRNIPTVDDGADITTAAMRRHGVSRAAIIAHSYGTCIAARIVKLRPEAVHTLALIDPVCFMMFYPNLVKFFFYSTHLCGVWFADMLIALLSSEIHCARNFCRYFFWTSINLWDEHLPDRTLVVLSGCDILSPTLYVRAWLESHTKAKVLYNPTAAHGAGLLLSPSWQCTIMQHLLQLLQSPSSAQAVSAAVDGACEEAAAAAALAPAADDVQVVAGAAAAGSDGVEAAVEVEDGGDAGAAAALQLAGDNVSRKDAFITGLGEDVDLDSLWEATNSFVSGWVNVLRTSASSLRLRKGAAAVGQCWQADAAVARGYDQLRNPLRVES